jgi:phosphatidylglycerophosphatase A
VFRHPAHFIALGGGIGLVPVAPGTFGTLAAFPIFWLVAPLHPGLYLAGVVLLFAIGVWACDVTGRALGEPDAGAMVWDETVAFLFVLFFTPMTLYWQAFAFVAFRVFDIAKPQPIRYYERICKGGWGVMIDDILAAFYALLVLSVARLAIG